jgi:hypothetical protein
MESKSNTQIAPKFILKLENNEENRILFYKKLFWK